MLRVVPPDESDIEALETLDGSSVSENAIWTGSESATFVAFCAGVRIAIEGGVRSTQIVTGFEVMVVPPIVAVASTWCDPSLVFFVSHA